MAGPQYQKPGGGTNFLCLHGNPQWKKYFDGDDHSGLLVGVKYKLYRLSQNGVFSEANNGGNPLVDNPAACAVCYVAGRSTILMVPARTQCPDGWTTEYAGYLASAYTDSAGINQHHYSSYICLDEAPEVGSGGRNIDQALIYVVEVGCGTLPCSEYINNRELACVVCSKGRFPLPEFTGRVHGPS